MGTRLNMSYSRHPETGELTERVNITFQHIPRCFCYYDGSNWTNMLPKVEFAYAATRALGIEHTPFDANFCFHLSSHLTYFSACDLRIQFRKTRQSG
jgi:hypothetical protein